MSQPLFEEMRLDEQTHRPLTPLQVRAATRQQHREDVEAQRIIRRNALGYFFGHRSAGEASLEQRRLADSRMRLQRLKDVAARVQDRLIEAVRAAGAAIEAGEPRAAKKCILDAALAFQDLSCLSTDMRNVGLRADGDHYASVADLFGSQLQDKVATADDSVREHFDDVFVDVAGKIEAYHDSAAAMLTQPPGAK